MAFQIGIENNHSGCRTIAWALEHPGCFAYGHDPSSARKALITAIKDYVSWITDHEKPWIETVSIEFSTEETWTDYQIDETYTRVEEGGYEVEAFFLYDWKPLTALDIERGIKLLVWSRTDLLSIIKGMSEEKLNQTYPDERWSIAGILSHIGGADWWYLDRLGLAIPRSEVPVEPVERLEKVRGFLLGILPELQGSKQVVGVDGEFWSPRKLLRRAVWHERDHTDHIRKLL